MPRTHLGPGPGKYLLPPLVGYKDHDTSRYRNPQYSMGIRLGTQQKGLGPGPKYNTEYMTTYGKAHPPAYSVKSRPRDLSTFHGPGPAAYGLQDAPRMKEPRPPAYSMASRVGITNKSITPGPNNYDIPTTLGPKVPDMHAEGAFSMSSRYPVLGKEQSPGPAKYDPTNPSTYKNKQPMYTMSNRHGTDNKAISPGPSAYYPQQKGKGGYSFGLKTDTDPYITADDEMPCVNK